MRVNTQRTFTHTVKVEQKRDKKSRQSKEMKCQSRSDPPALDGPTVLEPRQPATAQVHALSAQTSDKPSAVKPNRSVKCSVCDTVCL
ncbi:unnamed protein product [Colias eurytheme]|nr:unnamed protein product [Colias eurytheme]